MDPYNAPIAGGTARGGLIALLVIMVLLGGLLAYGTLVSPPAETPPVGEANPPQSIIGGDAPEEAR
jgi:hypothetical protein